MVTRTTVGGFAGLVAAALFAAGCGEPTAPAHVSPAPGNPGAVALATGEGLAAATAPTGIVLNQVNGSLNLSGNFLIKGFNPTNPHHGDAIVATFVWLGSTNIIDSVTDVLTTSPYTPVGNAYTLVDYVTTGGISMATYVATNVQNFPDPNNPADGIVLAVRANLSQSVTDGGILISSYSGVSAVSAVAVGAHHSGSGSGSTTTVADAGAIPVGTGALTYGVTLSNGLAGRDPPPGFANVTTMSDLTPLVTEADYAVQATAGTVDPRWTWYFSSPSSWLATALTLNPPLHLGFTVQPSTTLPLLTIQPAVQVTVLDAFGNRNTSYTGQVTIAIGHNGGLLAPGTLSGTKTVTVVNGVATFSDLSIDEPGNGYTLVVSGPTLTGAESTPFDIGAF